MSAKKNRGPVDVFIPRDFVNGMLYALDCFIRADPENVWAEHARYLKEKVIKYARTFQYHGDDSAAIYFYEEEAATLIKLLPYFVLLIKKPQTDYYSLIVNRREKVKEEKSE